MERRKLLLLVLVGLLMAVPLASRSHAQIDVNGYKIVGYYTGYNIYTDYFVTDIPAEFLTHLNYAFLTISENGQCDFTDEWTDTGFRYPGDEETERLRGNFKQLGLLKGEFPGLQVLLVIGGWENSANLSDVAATAQSRTRFVRSCVAMMRQYDFDGFDIDWRFPVVGGINGMGSPSDSENLTALLQEFRVALDEAGADDERTYLLSATVPTTEALYENFEINNIHLYVDWLNLAAYGFHGDWSDVATHHAALYSNIRDPRGEYMQQNFNVNAAVNVYLDAGVPSEKIVVGIPLYGQAWQISELNDYFGLYAPVAGIPGGTRGGGTLYYKDIERLMENPGFVRFFDQETRSPWLYNSGERIVISYEDAESIAYKTLYIQRQGLAGASVWELSFDDPTHTLIESLYEGLVQGGS